LNPSDVFRFILALVLLPPILRIGRGIRLPQGRQAFTYGLLLIVLAFAIQSIGPLVPWTGLRFVRHLVFAAGGFCFAWAAWVARRHELFLTGAQR
jgi:hypothetical protein